MSHGISVEDRLRQAEGEAAALPVRVEGDLDAVTAPALRARLLRLLSRGHAHLLVDLADCRYVDSSGMLALITAGDRAAAQGGSVRLQNAPPLLLKMLRFAHLGKVLGVPGEETPHPCRRQPGPDTAVGQWQVRRIVQQAVPHASVLVRKAVLDEARATPLTNADLADVELAVGEAFANAVRHGSPRGAQDQVVTRALVGTEAFVAEVRDCGEGFDPAQIETPNPERLREGGWSLFYMRAIMDWVEFERDRQGATVRLVKLYPRSE